jgi:predicted transcriptional regulator
MDAAMPAPARKSVRTSVILPEDAHARIQALADASNVSAAWVIRAAILRFLEEHAGDQSELPLRLPKAKKANHA